MHFFLTILLMKNVILVPGRTFTHVEINRWNLLVWSTKDHILNIDHVILNQKWGNLNKHHKKHPFKSNAAIYSSHFSIWAWLIWILGVRLSHLTLELCRNCCNSHTNMFSFCQRHRLHYVELQPKSINKQVILIKNIFRKFFSQLWVNLMQF